MSSNFTCISCRSSFPHSDAQREHYKSDWHRYNLKRKVAQLPPVDFENFKERVLAHRDQKEEELRNPGDRTKYCHDCGKNFGNYNAYTNHLKSKKHVENNQNQKEKREEWEQMEHVRRENEKNKIKSANVGAWKKYLEDLKSTVATSTRPVKNEPEAPEQTQDAEDYDDDMPDLEADDEEGDRDGDNDNEDNDDEEWEDVTEDEDQDQDQDRGVGEGEGYELDTSRVDQCLFCSFKSKNLEANVGHMTREHSFFIPDAEYCHDMVGLVAYLWEKIAEYNVCIWCNNKGRNFATEEAVQKHMADKGHCKMKHEGEALIEYEDYYDYTASYPRDQRGDGDPDEEVPLNVLDADGYELVLPSGATVGHRSLLKYYKQKLPPVRAMPRTPKHLLHNVLSQYRALGWTGTAGEAAVRKAKDLKYMQYVRAKQNMRQGVKNNKLQHHFRAQVLF